MDQGRRVGEDKGEEVIDRVRQSPGDLVVQLEP